MKIPHVIAFAFCAVLAATALAKDKEKEPVVGYRIDFAKSKLDSDGIPEKWTYKGKIGTPDPTYEIVKDSETGTNVLKIMCTKATGAILFDVKDVDFDKYPIMRWKWKVEKLPAGADAREDAKDDQGIGIYMGYGKLSQTSVAYRWETVTPKGLTGTAKYGAGLVKVFWESTRNQEDGLNKWYVDECNVKKDLIKALDVDKFPAKNTAVSISTNSQYTGTEAISYLEYIEFVSAPSKKEEK